MEDTDGDEAVDIDDAAAVKNSGGDGEDKAYASDSDADLVASWKNEEAIVAEDASAAEGCYSVAKTSIAVPVMRKQGLIAVVSQPTLPD